MITHIIEASNSFNWGKFMLMRPDAEDWSRPSHAEPEAQSLLRACGWGSSHLWVLDLQTGEGAYFAPGGYAKADLEKHRIWTCVLYPDFLNWLYTQNLDDITVLPTVVQLETEGALYGRRQPGPMCTTHGHEDVPADRLVYIAEEHDDNPCTGHAYCVECASLLEAS